MKRKRYPETMIETLPGHVQDSTRRGHRPFLTITVDPFTFATLDRICDELGESRGKVIDSAIEAFALALHGKEHGT